MNDDTAALWERLRAPFDADQHELLPQQMSKNDTDKYQCRQGTRASADDVYCGGFHARSIHLTYVGHAGVTMRLNDVDPTWTWEPLALDQRGLPLQADGGLWIRLTILGVTRIGFGDAKGKSGPSATKELIGDAVRVTAMRFGVGTYLWSKSERSQAMATREGADVEDAPQVTRQQAPAGPAPEVVARWTQRLAQAATHPYGSEDRQAVVSEVWQAAGSAGLSVVVDVPEPWRPAVGSSRAMLGDLARCIAQDSRITALPEVSA